jgi:hypothetical protein
LQILRLSSCRTDAVAKVITHIGGHIIILVWDTGIYNEILPLLSIDPYEYDIHSSTANFILQSLSIVEWDEEEVEPILSQAFILSTLFDNSPNHLS